MWEENRASPSSSPIAPSHPGFCHFGGWILLHILRGRMIYSLLNHPALISSPCFLPTCLVRAPLPSRRDVARLEAWSSQAVKPN